MTTVSRAKGLGGTDVAAIVGVHPQKSAWDVYADKTGLLDQIVRETDARMAWGTRLQKIIAEAYAETTNRRVAWCDETQRGRHDFQVWTPDALCVLDPRIVECKTGGLDQIAKWGDPGTDEVPEHYAVQGHWYLNASGREALDFAVLFAGSDFRIYTLHRDQDIEEMLVAAAERFWRDHVIAGNPPEIENTDTAAAYLRSRFPRNNGNLRAPTMDEAELIGRYRLARASHETAARLKGDLEMQIKFAIGESDGLEWGVGKSKEHFTYKRSKDSSETDWESVARGLATKVTDEEFKTLVALQTRPVPGARRIHVKFEKEQ